MVRSTPFSVGLFYRQSSNDNSGNFTASSWFHVESKENPADCATRGLLPGSLAEHELWWTGPQFLRSAPCDWPKKPEKIILQDESVLERRAAYKPCFMTQPTHTDFPLAAMLHSYSSLDRLLKATAHLIRFSDRKNWKKLASASISTMEIESAGDMWVRILQTQYFAEELGDIRDSKSVSNSSRLKSLAPFIDDRALMRVYGRLEHAHMPFNERHPIILPNKNHFITLIIRNAHHKTLHGGSQLTAQYIRQRYWILHARQTIKSVLHACVTCFRYKAKAAIQMMGALPNPRVQPSMPFTHVGVDYAGYFDVKTSALRNAPYCKCYIALFVCLCIKAFHLELVENLTTEAFIAAFRRMAARRGLPTDIYMDNGLYFVGASNELPKLLLKSQSDCSQEIIEALRKDGTQFHFIPPHAPHFGGLWEAGVKSTKYHMKRIIGDTRLRYEQFTTLITQIEAVLNSRPLCPVTSDPSETQVITPAHFLIGKSLFTVPSPNYTGILDTRLNSYELIQKMFQSFWQIWSTEYLHRLQQRPKWAQAKLNLRVGQIVLIKEDNLPPGKWLIGLITGTIEGKDGKVRVVNLKTATSTLQRPIHKVCLLPIEDN